MYETIPLPNGVRILTERVPYVRSAALGIWVGTGSRHERSGASSYMPISSRMTPRSVATSASSNREEKNMSHRISAAWGS